MKFYKYTAIGNDFVLLDEFDESHMEPEFVKAVCDRKFGVGADGILYVSKGGKCDYRMQIMNADGTRAEMCGNGIRCVGRHVFKESGTVESDAGEFEIAVGKDVKATWNLPEPEAKKISCCGRNMVSVSTGNPHAIMFVDEINMGEVAEFGPRIENDEMFPNRTNVEFAQVISKNEVKLVVHERGVGVTLACGTGSIATCIAGIKEGLLESPVTVHLPGGDLVIEVREGKISMTGAADLVFEGVDLNAVKRA
jgi:diaminopimelate epimerase